MKREGHNKATFFVGAEVEHTPAFSKKTLFVVGIQPVEKIEEYAREHKTPHIFMGANQSFELSNPGYWDNVISVLLGKGFTVTLDYAVDLHKTVLNVLSPIVWQNRNFIPLLSVRIPKVETSSPNLTVKIDDIDFGATNPGVWCYHFHEITDSNRFTAWGEYSNDHVIDSLPLPVLMPVIKNVEEKTLIERLNEEIKGPLNNSDLGLDTEPTTALKPEPTETQPAIIAAIVKTPEDAAAAYAGDAKVDPLGKDASKKPKAKKQ